jgi:hypothetical protein
MQYDFNLILKLADECEKGEGSDRTLDSAIEAATQSPYVSSHYTSSIDDAEALRSRLLPGSTISIDQDPKGFIVWVWVDYFSNPFSKSWSTSEPRARNAATLRAFVAKERAK